MPNDIIGMASIRYLCHLRKLALLGSLTYLVTAGLYALRWKAI